MKSHIKIFSEIGINYVDIVGRKNASLGEIHNQITSNGVLIPNGFATTSSTFWEFLKENNIQIALENILKELNRKTFVFFLVREGIDSISINRDVLLQGIENINKAEKEILAKSPVLN